MMRTPEYVTRQATLAESVGKAFNRTGYVGLHPAGCFGKM
jgi:hypothetical protein